MYVKSSQMDKIVCSRFRLKKKLGAGSFGEIYLAENKTTHRRVAVKIEKSNCKVPQLAFEAKVYKLMTGGTGIPKLHYYGQDTLCNVMVVDLLGKSLEDLLAQCHRRMSLKTVLMLADQMISCIEFMHSKNYIHRDIKPDNFVMGLGKSANQVFIIDYGLAKKYRDTNSHAHIPWSEGKQLTGTARYASSNALRGYEQSRRDDMEGLGYVLIYLLRGSLPWMGINAKNRKQKYDKICEMKLKTPVEDLCRGLPPEFIQYFTYVRNLRFTEQPNYAWMRSLFRNLFTKSDFVYDYKYDWNNPRPENAVPVVRPATAQKKIVVQKMPDVEHRKSNITTARGTINTTTSAMIAKMSTERDTGVIHAHKYDLKLAERMNNLNNGRMACRFMDRDGNRTARKSSVSVKRKTVIDSDKQKTQDNCLRRMMMPKWVSSQNLLTPGRCMY